MKNAFYMTKNKPCWTKNKPVLTKNKPCWTKNKPVLTKSKPSLTKYFYVDNDNETILNLLFL
jgi:hypothetical protein